MSSSSQSNLPFRTLGHRLKRFRLKQSQSLAEVSGAVEIDEKLLSRIEDGLERPAEDILELLINYFDVQEKDAINLWSLAGYDTDDLEVDDSPLADLPKQIIMLLALEPRTFYTDSLEIHYDNNGLLLNFKQVAGQNQPISVAKLGMSYEQAEQVHKTLQKVLLHAKYLKGPKTLPRSIKKRPH